MTDTVVTADSSTVVVDSPVVQNIVTAESVANTIIVTGIMGLPGVTSIADLTDIDKTGLVSGATLVYNEDSAMWEATRLLNNQILEAGQF